MAKTEALSSTPSLGRVAVAAMLAAMLVGCANQSASGNVYNYNQAQREQIQRLGTVVSVRNITIQPQASSGVGTVAGAAVGGVAASSIGGGTGRIIASVLGGVAGGLLGNEVEKGATRKAGYEITVRMDNGETRVVAQEADIALRPGQRVAVISGAGPVRVVPAR